MLALFALPRLDKKGDKDDADSNAAVIDDLKSEATPKVSDRFEIDDTSQRAKDLTSNPLCNAARNGDLMVVMSLIESVDYKPTQEEIDKATLEAASTGHINVFEYLLPSCTVVGAVSILQIASKNGKMAVVKALATRNDVNIDTPDDTGQPPLARAAEDGNLEMVKLLLDMGANAKSGYHSILGSTNRGERQAIVSLLANQVAVQTRHLSRTAELSNKEAGSPGTTVANKKFRYETGEIRSDYTALLVANGFVPHGPTIGRRGDCYVQRVDS